MKSMVYVVLDNGDVLGVYDKYEDAENATIRYATEQATITPVVIGRTDDLRNGCNNPAEVIKAMEKELKESPFEAFPEEEEEEDEHKYCDSAADCCFCNSDDEDEDEDEEEEDDDDAVYSLTAKGEFVLRYMEAGHTFEEACEIANILFGKGE